MELICHSCNKTFSCRIPNSYDWLFLQKLDSTISDYIRLNYEKPLCQDCTNIIRETFYQVNINPNRKK